MAEMREKTAILDAGEHLLRVPQERKLVSILFADVRALLPCLRPWIMK